MNQMLNLTTYSCNTKSQNAYMWKQKDKLNDEKVISLCELTIIFGARGGARVPLEQFSVHFACGCDLF